jgi:hypothetical protein
MRKDGCFLNGLAPQLGLEPETYGLTAQTFLDRLFNFNDLVPKNWTVRRVNRHTQEATGTKDAIDHLRS